MRIRLSGFAFYSIYLVIALRLLLSNWTLNSFYPYSLEGGFWFQKIHPGSYVALASLVFLVLLRGVRKFVFEQYHFDKSILIFSLTLIFILAYQIIIIKSSGVSYLVDTFIAPLVLLFLLKYTTDSQKRTLTFLVLNIVLINSLIAISEYLFRVHFLQPEVDFAFFRASAMFGHPLHNGLITVTACFAVLIIPTKLIYKYIYILTYIASLFAFGARGSLAVLLASLAVFIVICPYHANGSLHVRLGKILASKLLLLALFFGLVIVSFYTEFGSSIATRLTMDSSIEARFHSIYVLNYFTISEIFWGLDQSSRFYLTEQYGKISVIENFWIVLLLNFGLPLFVVFVLSFLFLLYCQILKSGWRAVLFSALFIVAASTNNSLSSKSASLCVFFLLFFTTGRVAVKDFKW